MTLIQNRLSTLSKLMTTHREPAVRWSRIRDTGYGMRWQDSRREHLAAGSYFHACSGRGWINSSFSLCKPPIFLYDRDRLTIRRHTVMLQIKNPVLPGFNADPSIIRVDDTYYIANSTFEWFPGVRLHESKDLVLGIFFHPHCPRRHCLIWKEIRHREVSGRRICPMQMENSGWFIRM